jgi:hypothetical protein
MDVADQAVHARYKSEREKEMLLRSRAIFRNIRSEGRLSNRQAQRHSSIAIGLIIPRLKVSSVDEKKVSTVQSYIDFAWFGLVNCRLLQLNSLIITS